MEEIILRILQDDFKGFYNETEGKQDIEKDI